jgi:hypothetical protein
LAHRCRRGASTPSRWLIDTFLLAPGNSRGLDKVARLYGLEKMPLPPGAIQRMDLLLHDDRERYDEYAIQDARVAAIHAAEVAKFAEQESSPGKIPVTLSALGVNILLSRWQDGGLDRLHLTGKTRQKIPGRRGRPEIVKIRSVAVIARPSAPTADWKGIPPDTASTSPRSSA